MGMTCQSQSVQEHHVQGGIASLTPWGLLG